MLHGHEEANEHLRMFDEPSRVQDGAQISQQNRLLRVRFNSWSSHWRCWRIAQRQRKCVDMQSTTAGTHVNSSWTHGVLSVMDIRVFQACVEVNVKAGGMFLRITQNGQFVQLLSGACRALVR